MLSILFRQIEMVPTNKSGFQKSFFEQTSLDVVG